MDTDLDYVLGGFVTRTVTFPLWDGGAIRIVDIGTDVLDTAKLSVFNISKNSTTIEVLLGMRLINLLSQTVMNFIIVTYLMLIVLQNLESP